MSSEVERTSDGRYIVVGGRRWRATDPSIPERLRKELVVELMDARRAVKAAKGEPDATATARERVQRAKVALGERGEKWWESPSEKGQAERAGATILALLTKRGPDSSICPSDAARVIASPEWRPALAAVRATATNLAEQGALQITQGGTVVETPVTISGPVRYRLPSAPP